MTTMRDDGSEPSGEGILHPEGMRAVRDLAAGVVHEINNVLGVIIGNAHLAKKNAKNLGSLEKYLGELRDAAEEGRELMRDLSILAGVESSRVRTLSLNDLVTNALSGLGTPAKRDLSSQDPMVRLDLWLAQDTLSAAARFMAEAKKVTSIRVATRVVGSAAALTIEDNGPSPTEKELRNVFTPFAKLDGRPHVGLRLTKLADLASRSNGRVTASVRDPHGLRLVLSLPVSDGSDSGDSPGVPLSKKGM